MGFLRLLNPQGMVGIAIAVILCALLIVQKIETRHWKKQSAQFEQLYRGEVRAHAQTVSNYRAAAKQARAADKANAERVKAEQAAINERTNDDLQARLADARARYERLRQSAQAPSNPGGGRTAPVPGVRAPASGPAQSAGQDRLSDSDRLIATEQAIQLDELINWVKRQAGVDTNDNN
jgi:hypothetical protein